MVKYAGEVIKMLKEEDTKSFFRYRREVKWDRQVNALLDSIKDKEKIAIMYCGNVTKTYDFSKKGEVELAVEINNLVQDYIPLQYRAYFRNQVNVILKVLVSLEKDIELKKVIERKQV